MVSSLSISEAALRLFGRPQALNRSAPDDASRDGMGPSSPRLNAAPVSYVETFTDVSRAVDLSIVSDPDVHNTLYGMQQGRDILARIDDSIQRVVMISPSHLKQCGIGEYGRYLAGQFEKQVEEVHVVRTSSAALDLGDETLDGALVIVNHGPGLFDGLNPRLSQGESTTQLLQNLELLKKHKNALPLIIHHSLLDTDHDLLFSRQSQILGSSIPSVTFISSAGRHFFMPSLELGVSPVPVPKHRYKGDRDERPEVVGFFGFFQYGGKDFDSLFHLVREIRGSLVGSVATGNASELEKFNETLEDLNLPHDFGSGWVDDTELLKRLLKADYFYLPQNDYDHWNNSATARFVTNLDRPLFLPPHHPFLDMADGSIFASKEDLPRIVAHFREKGHFARAVERVKAFRNRASMANTAHFIRTGLAARQSETGSELMESPSACSAERFLELGPEEQDRFANALGADGSNFDSFPAYWRAPEGRQYWRKHYELGDFIQPTLLESISAIFLACTKRHVEFPEVLALITNLMDEDPDSDVSFGAIVQSAFFEAMTKRGGPFYDPEIVLLKNGEVADWRAEMTENAIEEFHTAKEARQSQIRSYLEALADDGEEPPITNIADLLTLPSATLSRRRSSIDLSGIDFDYVHAVRRPSQRLTRLVSEANKVGVSLNDGLVFDHKTPSEVAPKVRVYDLEDFIYYSGDMFVLNAVRCIEKRNPFPLEAFTLLSMMGALGKKAVLEHLILRANGRVRIRNLDHEPSLTDTDFDRFMHAARDPLAGLIDARNAYEIAKRNNFRWWLRSKSVADKMYADAGQSYELINLVYARLTNPQTWSGRESDPIRKLAADGRFYPERTAGNGALSITAKNGFVPSLSLSEMFASASEGFHDIEEGSVWTDGPSGTIYLSLDDQLPKSNRKLALDLGFFGSRGFDEPRMLTISLFGLDAPTSTETGSADVVAMIEYEVNQDDPVTFEVALPVGMEPGVYRLDMDVQKAISPLDAKVSEDVRQLGIRIDSLHIAT